MYGFYSHCYPAGPNLEDENCTILRATSKIDRQRNMNRKGTYIFSHFSALSELRYHRPLHRLLGRVNRSLFGGQYRGHAGMLPIFAMHACQA
jgi:hypothetical protein